MDFRAGACEYEMVRIFLSVCSSLPRREVKMSQNIAGIDVHKKLLVVVIVDRTRPDVVLQIRRFGTGSGELRHLSAWLCQYGVEEAFFNSARMLSCAPPVRC